MQTAINPAGFRHAVVVFRSRVIVARIEFFHRNLVRRVAIYLICAEKNEDRIRAMLPRHFQKIDGPQGIHFEIQQRNIPRLVMRRLHRVSPAGPKNTRRMLLSTPNTSWPWRSKCSTASDPINPLLPVTRTFIEQQAYQKKCIKPETWATCRPSSAKLLVRRLVSLVLFPPAFC